MTGFQRRYSTRYALCLETKIPFILSEIEKEILSILFLILLILLKIFPYKRRVRVALTASQSMTWKKASMYLARALWKS